MSIRNRVPSGRALNLVSSRIPGSPGRGAAPLRRQLVRLAGRLLIAHDRAIDLAALDPELGGQDLEEARPPVGLRPR